MLNRLPLHLQDTASMHEEFKASAPFSADGITTAQALEQIVAIKEKLTSARTKVCCCCCCCARIAVLLQAFCAWLLPACMLQL